MDGTLIDSGAVVPDAFIATVQAIGGITYTRKQVIDLYPVGPPARLLTCPLRRPSTAADLAEYHQRLRATASTIQPYPEVASVLSMLHGRLAMAVFTGASSQAAHLLLEETGLLDHFHVVVAGDQVDRQKPHPDGILVQRLAAVGAGRPTDREDGARLARERSRAAYPRPGAEHPWRLNHSVWQPTRGRAG